MIERTFFVSGGVLVTNVSFKIPARSYPMSGITSVKGSRKDPSPAGPILLAVLGVFAILAGKLGVLLTIACIAGAVAWWMKQKPVFSVIISGASGQETALSSADGSFITSVIGAVNDAILHRSVGPP